MEFKLETNRDVLTKTLLLGVGSALVGLPLAAVTTHAGGLLFYFSCLLIWPISLTVWIGDLIFGKEFVRGDAFWFILFWSQAVGYFVLMVAIRWLRKVLKAKQQSKEVTRSNN